MSVRNGKRLLSLLLVFCLTMGCLPVVAFGAEAVQSNAQPQFSADRELTEAECMEIAKTYWDRPNGEGITGGKLITFQGKKYYNYILRAYVEDHATAIDYLFVETATGDCYFGLDKPEYQVFTGYEEVLQRLIKERKHELYSDWENTWNRGFFFDIDGDSREELLILRKVTGENNIDCLTGMAFTTSGGKVVPLIEESILQYNVAGPRTAIRILKKSGKNYISVFSRNSATEGDSRYENGSHRIYEVYGGFESVTSVYDNPTVVKYEMVEKYKSGKTEVDMQESSASIDGKKVTYQEYLSYMQSFEEKEYVSTPFSEGMTDPTPRGYSFEELLAQCKTSDIPSDNPSFSDVPASAYYYDAVAWAAENEITLGTDKTHFSPEQRCTRGQIVTFLWRALGKTEPNSGLSNFSDVKKNAYYEKAVRWAVEEGITNGTGKGKFSPEEGCTRAQAVTFLWRAAGEPEPSRTAKSFSDVKQGSYYEKAVKWAVEKGITAGTGNGKFSPEDRCTRAQIVSFLYRAYH